MAKAKDGLLFEGAEMAKAKAKPQERIHVRMVRCPQQYPAAPHTADVHPAEVENYRRGGWTIAKDGK